MQDDEGIGMKVTYEIMKIKDHMPRRTPSIHKKDINVLIDNLGDAGVEINCDKSERHVTYIIASKPKIADIPLFLLFPDSKIQSYTLRGSDLELTLKNFCDRNHETGVRATLTYEKETVAEIVCEVLEETYEGEISIS